MNNYNAWQRHQVHDYDDCLRRKVEAARISMRAGRGRSNDEVEATFTAKRHQILSFYEHRAKH